MRLNFSGVGEEDIREGVRRIGEVVREQEDLLGTLTGRARSVPAAPAAAPTAPSNVVALPPRPGADGQRRSAAPPPA
jgi:2-aminoadipate transaminase